MRYFLAFLGFLASSASPPAAFIDATAASRIGFTFAASKTPDKYLIEAMGGGVAMLDADGDGRFFFVNGATLRPGMTANWCGGKRALRAYRHPNEFAPVTHLLYRNLGGCRFEDVSAKAGLLKSPGKGLGVAFEDIDRDGWPDILVANVHFGLGRDRAVAPLETRWPNGLTEGKP